MESGIQKASSNIDSLLSAAGNVAGFFGKFQKIADVSDSMMMSTAHLNSVNDGSQSTDDLESKIFASSQRSRSGYQSNIDMVSNLGQTGAFESNDEEIAFAEDLNKVYATAGLSQEQMGASSSAITDALSSGTINAEQLNSILETTPDIFSTMADYLDVPSEKLMEMASNGQISSDMLKNSVLQSTGEIDSKFSGLPVSISDCWAQTMDKILFACQPLIEFVNLLAQNWSIVEPIILGVAAAFGILSVASNVLSFMTVMMELFNAVLRQCPFILIILAIITVITVICFLVSIFNHFTGQTISGIGLIVGVIFAALAIIWNIFVAVFNGIMQLIWTIFIQPWISIMEWVLNVFNGGFNSFGDAIKNLIGQIISWFLSLGKVVTKIIDAIFGTNWTAGLSKLQDKLTSWGGNEKKITLDKNYNGLGRIEVGNSFKTGYGMGEGLGSKFKQDKIDTNLLGQNKDLPKNPNIIPNKNDDIIQNQNYGGLNSSLPQKTDEIASNTGAIKDSVSASDEDLTYLRDLAEQETINNFTTAEIKVEMRNNMRVNKNMDLDGIVNYLEEKVSETMSTTAEGVY